MARSVGKGNKCECARQVCKIFVCTETCTKWRHFHRKKTSNFSLERGNNPPHTHIQYGGKISSSHPITRGLCRYPFSVILIYAPVDGHRTMYITGPTALRCLSRVTINRTSSRCWNKAKLSKCSHCCTHLCLSPPPRLAWPVWISNVGIHEVMKEFRR